MESINEEDQLAISTAESYLQRYPLQTEQAHQFSEKDQHLNPKIMVKAALDFAPTVSGRVNIAKAIVNADENSLHEPFNTRLEELAKQIFCKLLVPMKAKGGCTPRRPSTPPSHYELNPKDIESVHRRSTCRATVLKRFNYTCPMTGYRDEHDPTPTDYEITQLTLDCAHIIPHFLGGEGRTPQEANDRLKTWSLLNLFSGAPVYEMLRGPLIDSVENVIPLQADHHQAFGSMRLWFTDRRGEDGIYDVHIVTRGGEELPGFNVMPGSKACGEKVDLRSVSTLYPEVSPLFLRIHAALCQVLHASGAGTAIDKTLLEWRRFRRLAGDGRDAELLSARLSLIQ